MFIFIVTYRARGTQQFRRDELINFLDNFRKYMKKNNVNYKLIITEQNNDDPFNRGALYNIGFLESEKRFKFFKKYIMANVDFTFNEDIEFPSDFLLFNNGFIDIYTIGENLPIIGACFCVDPLSYLLTNGFPIDFYGWGGEDFAVFNRIRQRRVPYNRSILNIGIIKDESGWVIDNKETIVNNDYDTNQRNISKANNDRIFGNGLDKCYYDLIGYGEFHNNSNIIHLIVSFDFK